MTLIEESGLIWIIYIWCSVQVIDWLTGTGISSVILIIIKDNIGNENEPCWHHHKEPAIVHCWTNSLKPNFCTWLVMKATKYLESMLANPT